MTTAAKPKPPTIDDIYESAEKRGLKNLVCLSLRSGVSDGHGTPEDPFNVGGKGATAELDKAKRLDAIMQSYQGEGVFFNFVTPNEVYCTDFHNRKWEPRGRHVYAGLGMFSTTLKAVTSAKELPNYDHEVLKTTWDQTPRGIRVENMTLDCNGAAMAALAPQVGGEGDIAIFGTDLNGSDILLYRVRCIHQHGTRTSANTNPKESFGLAIKSPSSESAVGNIMRECLVELPVGSYGNPYALFGSEAHPQINSHLIDCRARGINNGLDPVLNTGGLNCGYLKDCTVQRCEFVDCDSILYCDTGTLENIDVDYSRLIRGREGVACVANGVTDAYPKGGAWWKKNIRVRGNYIHIQNRIEKGGVYGVVMSNAPTNGFEISGNTIVVARDGGGLGQWWSLFLQSVSNGKIIENTCDDVSCLLETSASPNIRLSGNRTPSQGRLAGAVLMGATAPAFRRNFDDGLI
jgi:hypothetical protein